MDQLGQELDAHVGDGPVQQPRHVHLRETHPSGDLILTKSLRQ